MTIKAQISELDHWVFELDEFGYAFSLIKLVRENENAKREIIRLSEQIKDNEAAIMKKVASVWTASEIEEAQHKFDGKTHQQ